MIMHEVAAQYTKENLENFLMCVGAKLHADEDYDWNELPLEMIESNEVC